MQLLLTAIYTSLIVWIVGLAVPVTASYIICAVIAAPAMIKLGVPDFAAHMFIFYYAVLSEVSPPTALSPFAAAAITGGGPYRTTLQAWKYCAPAFLLPFMFVLDASGVALLLTGSFKNLAAANWGSIVAGHAHRRRLGIAALAGGLQGWLLHKTTLIERWMLIVAGIMLVYPAPLFDYIGFALVVAVVDPAENAQSRGGGRCGLRHAGTPSRENEDAVRGARHPHGRRARDGHRVPAGRRGGARTVERARRADVP